MECEHHEGTSQGGGQRGSLPVCWKAMYPDSQQQARAEQGYGEVAIGNQILEGNGDAGDQYTGLDRFGRVMDQRWLNGSGSSVGRSTSATPFTCAIRTAREN